MATKRIYIGGLTADISQKDVAGRFTPFGEVVSVEVIKAKAVGADPDTCRGFAYVTLNPKDDASMARMLSLYNGCKWRGQKLRVEVAKPDYLTRLQQERQEEEEKKQQQQDREAEQPQQQQSQQQDAGKDGEVGSEETHILRLPVPGSNHKTITVDLTAKSKSHRSWFPTHNSKRPHELDWEPLPPCKRSALQAAAEASMVGLDAAAAAQQLRATQELLANIAERQRWQQQLLVVPQGVAVPFTYQEQQQQQQQQPQEQPAGKKAKGSSKVVEQELLSQLKLLKRISEREQHGQQRQASRGSKAVVEFLDADDTKQQQQQQQQVKAVSGRAGSMQAGAAATAGAVKAGQGLNPLPNRVYDSDSDSESDGDMEVGRRGKQGELLVAAVTAAAAPANGTALSAPAPAPASKQQQQQQLPKLGKPKGPEQQLGAGGGDDPGLSDMSDVSSDYESDQWEQWLAAEGLAAAAADGTDSQPLAGAAADSGSDDMQGSMSSGDISSPGSDSGEGDALAAVGMSGHQQQKLKVSPVADRGAAPQKQPPKQQQQQQRQQQQGKQVAGKQEPSRQQQTKQQQQLQQQQGKQQPAGKAASQANAPAAPAGHKHDKPAAKHDLHAVPALAPAAAARSSPAAAARHLSAAAVSKPAGLWDLDRFGSDSEEVLVDVDSDGDVAMPAAAVAAPRKSTTKRKPQASRQQYSGDMLLCPKVRKG